MATTLTQNNNITAMDSNVTTSETYERYSPKENYWVGVYVSLVGK